MEGVGDAAGEEPVNQKCMTSQLSGRPNSALLAERKIGYVQTEKGGGYLLLNIYIMDLFRAIV